MDAWRPWREVHGVRAIPQIIHTVHSDGCAIWAVDMCEPGAGGRHEWQSARVSTVDVQKAWLVGACDHVRRFLHERGGRREGRSA